MKRRVWIALAVFAATCAAVALGFGPCVRSRIADRAARYGATVQVDSVMPTLAGLRLRGVRLEIAALPEVDARVDRIVLGWRDQRPVAMEGARIRAVGEPAELLRKVEQWRSGHGKGGGAPDGRPLELEGFEVRWQRSEADGSPAVVATAVRVSRRGADYSVGAGKVHAELPGIRLDANGPGVSFRRTEHGMRVTELVADGVRVEAWLGGTEGTVDRSAVLSTAGRGPADAEEEEPVGPVGGPSDAVASPGLEASARRPASSAGAEGEISGRGAAGAEGQISGRVVAARRVYSALMMAADRIAASLEAGARTRLAGVRAVVHLAGEQLTLGPGVLGVEVAESVVRVVLAPTPEVADARGGVGEVQALTFTTTIPRTSAAPDAAPPPIVAELQGGPVWLSALGVHDGDLGLQDVSTTAIEADARVQLPADGRSLSIDGRGRMQRLAIASARLAREPLRDVELGWMARGEVALDGSFVRLAEGAVDLGRIHLSLRGTYDRDGPSHRLDVAFEIPLVPCQQAFDSLPQALVPDVQGLRFAGSAGIKGHARFDTAKLDSTFDVGWDATNSCRVVQAPPKLQLETLRKPFERTVVGPDGRSARITLGPGSESFTPIAGISRYMEVAVLTTEDSHFHRHHGFDDEAIANSIRENLRAGRFVRGASTISMQLARNVYLGHERTLSRKLQEAILTLYLEQGLTKRELMELYLNVIEFGPMVYGVGHAARHYFGATPSQLSLGQALYLSSILPAPNKQHFGAGGVVSPGWSKHLRRLMKIVHKTRRIDDDELAEALRETVVFGSPSPRRAPPESTDDEGTVDETLSIDSTDPAPPTDEPPVTP